MAEVTLQHMQRDAAVQQACGDGVAESVGAVEVDQGAGAVTHVQPDGQIGQQIPQGVARVGPVAVAVHLRREEQVLRGPAGCAVFGEEPLRPSLLFADDRDDLGGHEDGVRRTVDLRLPVAQLGDQCLVVADCRGLVRRGRGCRRQRQQWVAVDRQISLTRRPSNATSMVIRMACSSPNPPSATAAPSRSSPPMIRVMASSSMTWPSSRGRGLPGSSTPVEAGVLGSQSQPARFGQRGGGRVLVVGHEQVELLHIAGQALHRRHCQVGEPGR